MAVASAWMDAGSFWVALAGVVFGLGALIVSVVLGLRSARAAEDSAHQARASAEATVDVVHVERERYHEEHYPEENGTFTYRSSQDRPARTELVFEFKLDRTFVIQAEAASGDSRAVNPLVVVPPEDGTHRVIVGDQPGEVDAIPWTHLTIRFWPPRHPPGRARPWSCPCGRPAGPGEGTAHWEWVVCVELPDGDDRKAHFSW